MTVPLDAARATLRRAAKQARPHAEGAQSTMLEREPRPWLQAPSARLRYAKGQYRSFDPEATAKAAHPRERTRRHPVPGDRMLLASSPDRAAGLVVMPKKPGARSVVDALIVGGRTTGLMLAIQLARQGLDVRIVDGSPGVDPHSRATLLHSRSLELVD